MRLPTTAAAALTAAALLLSPSPAAARGNGFLPRAPAAGESDTPEPPAGMSTVGGKLLGRPGTQVRLGAGAGKPPAGLTARSWIVADAESGEVLAARNAHWKLAPASTLKMLFADTVLPKLDRDEKHRVSMEELAGVAPGSSLVGIKENHTYSVHDMWLGVFLASGNDAVHVLSAMNGGVAKTVREMQLRADALQARDTHVVSPDGFDEPGQVSSAYDLTLFARSGLQKPDFRKYCATPTAEFPGKTGKGGKREAFTIQNTNRLLAGGYGLSPYPGLAGVKNGYTSHAGNTFTGVAERDGRTLLVTVMHPDSGGKTVYEEAAKLLDWGFGAAGRVRAVGHLVPPRGEQNMPGPHGGGRRPGAAHAPRADTPTASDGSTGMWPALGVTGTVLLLLAGAVVLVHRRWPLPAPGPEPGSGGTGARTGPDPRSGRERGTGSRRS